MAAIYATPRLSMVGEAFKAPILHEHEIKQKSSSVYAYFMSIDTYLAARISGIGIVSSVT